jgi:hypothetical protein
MAETDNSDGTRAVARTGTANNDRERVAGRYFDAINRRDLDGAVEPAAAWPGHTRAVTGNVRVQFERAAAA